MRLVYLMAFILLLGTIDVAAFGAILSGGMDLTAGTPYELMQVETCRGDVLLKVRSEIHQDPLGYSFANCKLQGELYHCPCTNPTPIVLITDAGLKNVLDVVVQYDPDGYERTYYFNNVRIGDPPKAPRKGFFERPQEEAGSFAGQVIGLLFIIGLIVFVIVIAFRKLMKEGGPGDMIDERYSWDKK